SARCSMALARGTPAGSLSTSKLIASEGVASAAPCPNPAALRPAVATLDAPATPVPPATSRPLTAAPTRGSVCGGCAHPHKRMWWLRQPSQLARPRRQSRAARVIAGARASGRRSWLAPARAGIAGGEADGLLGAVEQFVTERRGDQHARLVLQHPGV